jgi:hypothetical protein
MKPIPLNQSVKTEFAQLLRALYTGCITNDDFDEKASRLSAHDFAVDQIFRFGAWPTYSDTRTYRFIGPHALSREDKKVVARWVLFLKSGQPYSWPKYPHLPIWFILTVIFAPIPIAYFISLWILAAIGFPLAILADNIFGLMKGPSFKRYGDFDVWPFISKADFEKALLHPPYLAGAK